MEQPLKKKTFQNVSIKDAPIQDWVKLVNRRVLQTYPLYFTDENRAHDRKVIEK
jgi:monomeric isocitrate dehydrogenase